MNLLRQLFADFDDGLLLLVVQCRVVEGFLQLLLPAFEHRVLALVLLPHRHHNELPHENHSHVDQLSHQRVAQLRGAHVQFRVDVVNFGLQFLPNHPRNHLIRELRRIVEIGVFGVHRLGPALVVHDPKAQVADLGDESVEVEVVLDHEAHGVHHSRLIFTVEGVDEQLDLPSGLPVCYRLVGLRVAPHLLQVHMPAQPPHFVSGHNLLLDSEELSRFFLNSVYLLSLEAN